MPKMTRNQVKEFIRSDENWTIVPGNDVVRLERLDYEDLHFAAIAYRSVVDLGWERKEHYVEDFHRSVYFWFDPVMNAMTYGTSKTEMENKIFERSRS